MGQTLSSFCRFSCFVVNAHLNHGFQAQKGAILSKNLSQNLKKEIGSQSS
ncbi:hypothetical protein LEP1GSC016_3328 [Leptospira borgpetersenii serovar Hardjo-bovis str. Sponselee]|uniref:Uncharacterized protein n=1 Tax=Leptospira borgpetersenii serovar Hardjo-bovis str. Sponselee TaxID=1303729 RepID=M6C6K0_LEPBO|nr:hypothetical protein LEP1GSC016_3328 [Leptospira borgpetersenii serovar Hardjo-bovis str. Sponselee]